MKELNDDYRIQILIRKKGAPVSDSTEIKTEHCDDLEDLEHQITKFYLDKLTELEDTDV